MAKYLKLFNEHSEYKSFIQTEGFVRPNVSYCIQEDKVHYNPLPNANGHEYVDLGLPSGTLWAKKNVGATSETDSGLYFAWGETQGYTASQVGTNKNFSWSNYAFGSSSPFSKYDTDGLDHLELTDDAASVNMGGEWHMPNRAQMVELFSGTTNGFINSSGVFTQYGNWDSTGWHNDSTSTTAQTSFGTAGHIFFNTTYASVSDAINASDYLFIPAAGVCADVSVFDVGDLGCLWGSALYTENVNSAWCFDFDSHRAGVYNDGGRCSGRSVRGVVGQKTEIDKPSSGGGEA